MNSLEEQIKDTINRITEVDKRAMEEAGQRWNSIAKPLHSLGKLETDVIKIAGITGNAEFSIEKRALLVMCADNGIVEEGVTQTGQEVTAIVAENFLTGNTSAAIMCRQAKVDLFPYDIGMITDTKVPKCKIRYGTNNFRKEPAMTREEALQAIKTGMQIVKEKKKEGYQLLCIGEMGIGNTTTSSAVATVLLDRKPKELTGRGAGLHDAGLQKKIQVIEEAIGKWKPEKTDPVDILSKVGGLDLAAMAGVCLGGAVEHIPIVLDGFISDVAALLAVRMCPAVKDVLLVSHLSKEPGARLVLEELHASTGMHLGMCLGEGTGAVAYLPVLDLGLSVYHEMSTFGENQIEDYKDYSGGEQI